MVSTIEREAARQSSGIPDAADIHRLLTSICAAAGLALAVLAGRDGSPFWRCGRVIGAAALTFGVVAALRRAGARWAGRTAIGFGAVAAVVGTGFLPFLIKGGLSVTSVAAVLAATAGTVLGVGGAVIASEHTHIARRAGAIFGTVLGMVVVAWVAAPAVAATNVPRPQIRATPASRGLAYESVVLVTSDGIRLAGWYVPATNGAAVVLRHGAGSTRSSVLDEAVVLARHGFGVLLVDARGHGESGGRAMDFGWFGGIRDIEAATRFLAARPDVRADGIGVVGMSMGGEEAIGASGGNPLIAAVGRGKGTRVRRPADMAVGRVRVAWRSTRTGRTGARRHHRRPDRRITADVEPSSRRVVDRHPLSADRRRQDRQRDTGTQAHSDVLDTRSNADGADSADTDVLHVHQSSGFLNRVRWFDSGRGH